LPLDGARDAFQTGFVAEVDGRIVGTAALELFDDAALLRSVAVDATRRGEGLGRRLVDTAVAEARTRQLSSIYLLTTTAASFFTRFGFALASRVEVPGALQQSIEFQSACPASAAVLVIQLR
jgi:amino-acid N-acetyltransferase